MRYRIKDYTVNIWQYGIKLSFTVPSLADIDYDANKRITQEGETQIMEALRLIIDETAHIPMSSSMNKGSQFATGKFSIAPSGQYDPGVELYDLELYIHVPAGATITSTTSTSITYKITEGGVEKTYTLSTSDLITIEFDWGDNISDIHVDSESADNLAAFFNITPPVPDAVPMTQQEVEDDLDELWNLIISQ